MAKMEQRNAVPEGKVEDVKEKNKVQGERIAALEDKTINDQRNWFRFDVSHGALARSQAMLFPIYPAGIG